MPNLICVGGYQEGESGGGSSADLAFHIHCSLTEPATYVPYETLWCKTETQPSVVQVNEEIPAEPQEGMLWIRTKGNREFPNIRLLGADGEPSVFNRLVKVMLYTDGAWQDIYAYYHDTQAWCVLYLPGEYAIVTSSDVLRNDTISAVSVYDGETVWQYAMDNTEETTGLIISSVYGSGYALDQENNCLYIYNYLRGKTSGSSTYQYFTRLCKLYIPTKTLLFDQIDQVPYNSYSPQNVQYDILLDATKSVVYHNQQYTPGSNATCSQIYSYSTQTGTRTAFGAKESGDYSSYTRKLQCCSTDNRLFLVEYNTSGSSTIYYYYQLHNYPYGASSSTAVTETSLYSSKVSQKIFPMCRWSHQFDEQYYSNNKTLTVVKASGTLTADVSSAITHLLMTRQHNVLVAFGTILRVYDASGDSLAFVKDIQLPHESGSLYATKSGQILYDNYRLALVDGIETFVPYTTGTVACVSPSNLDTFPEEYETGGIV